MDVFNYIPTGEVNAIPAHDLAKVLGVQDHRTVRKLVEMARLNGDVICSSSYGYFRPADILELRQYVDRMSKRAETTFLVLRSARSLLRAMDGQTVIEGWEE